MRGARSGERVSFDVTLAVDELVTNAIGYGYDDGEHRIDVALRLEGYTLTVEIATDGKAFDPLQAPEQDMSCSGREARQGTDGLGLGAATVLCVSYGVDPGLTVLRCCALHFEVPQK